MAFFMKEFQHLKIPLKAIKAATKNFDERRVIGNGGFGKVYKGKLSHANRSKNMFAIKRLDPKYGQGDPEFYKEIRMLCCYRHENLISLLGFCNEEGEMILVYEYASRGSLDRLLSDVTLTWTQRIKICLDAAKGLSFLHDPNGTQQRVLHCDIKSANNLLDKNMIAKVSDFGLSKMGPAYQQYSHLITNPVGTPGYCDPLYMEAYQLTKESDVYSFGVVLFEVLCGRLCAEYSNGQLKVQHVPFWKKSCKQKELNKIIFRDLIPPMDPNSLEIFANIAYQCLHKSREERPPMSFVVEQLKISLEFQERPNHWPKKMPTYEVLVKDAITPPRHNHWPKKMPTYEGLVKDAVTPPRPNHWPKKMPTYEELVKDAVTPLIYESSEELKGRLSKGVLNGGKTVISYIAFDYIFEIFVESFK
ncbi:protein kinase-like domain-containing protein [Artemisia annua]|uniref:Protein kinase-like domain-containing protein n=1 Tax=Artemisia annua TaxID=35608 RepID=A0A2U1LEI7_ARTAN|nr:protein kinase-like domain-containing protein [Artemisia annua]